MKDRVMLGLKDSQGDAGYEYEPRSVVVSPKKPKSSRKGRLAKGKRNFNGSNNQSATAKQPAKKANNPPLVEKPSKGRDIDKSFERDVVKYKTAEPFLTEETLMEKNNHGMAGDESSALLYESPEQNEENSKAFMESIGTWINDLFSTMPNKRNLSPKNEKEVLNKELTPTEDDAEYLKSINAITEQFRKKLKNETTVHISAPEMPFELNFDNILDNPKKQKKRAKTQPQPLEGNTDWLEPFNDNFSVPNLSLPRQHNSTSHSSNLVIRTTESETSPRPVRTKNSLELNSVDLTKEKKKGKSKQQNRRGGSELEDYALPKAGELSKKILLNVSDQEKFAQFYKNTHLAAQDYGQRKNKKYQSNTRCYTTKAKGRGKFPSGSYSTANRATNYSSAPAVLPKCLGEVLNKGPFEHNRKNFRNSSKKAVSELSRDPLLFSKMKSGGAFPTIQELRSEAKASSDDLVKYLMKKIKSSRPHLAKKKGRTKVPQILGGARNRFMQSATNSLVSTVMAKKDTENQLNSKSSSRLLVENKMYPAKELVLKQSDTAMSLDLASAMSGNKFTKCSYFLEEEKSPEADILQEKDKRKYTKQSSDEFMKREPIKNEKYNKRQEVKRMLSDLDMKDVFQVTRAQSKKEQIKKQTPPEELLAGVENNNDWQNPRFQKEHELFRRNFRTVQAGQTEKTDGVVEGEEGSSHQGTEEPSTEAVSLQSDNETIVPQPLPNDQTEEEVAEQRDHPANPESAALVCSTQEQSRKEVEASPIEKPLPTKVEKKSPEKSPREKGSKIRFAKESEAKALMNPLMELCAGDAQRDAPKPFAVSIPPKEFRTGKGSENLLINRRYSTNTSRKVKETSASSARNEHDVCPSLYFFELNKEKEKEEKKKENHTKDGKPQPPKTSEGHCRFEIKKDRPGPDCKKES